MTSSRTATSIHIAARFKVNNIYFEYILWGIDLGKKIFLLQVILSRICSNFHESYATPAIQIRVKFIQSSLEEYPHIFFIVHQHAFTIDLYTVVLRYESIRTLGIICKISIKSALNDTNNRAVCMYHALDFHGQFLPFLSIIQSLIIRKKTKFSQRYS